MKHYLRLLAYLNPYRFRLGAAFVCALLVAGLSAAYALLQLTYIMLCYRQQGSGNLSQILILTSIMARLKRQ